MKILSLALLFLTPLCYSFSAQAETVYIRPLYSSDAHLPTTFIPFQVLSTDGDLFNITSVNLNEPNSECRTFKDPYRTNTFIVKCLTESRLNVNIQAVSLKRAVVLNYGPIEIKNPFSDVIIVEQPPEVDTDYVMGKQLYGSSCFNCHNPVHVKKGRTFQQIKNAIINIPEMNGTNGPNLILELTDDSIRKIEKYLGNP